MFTEHAFLNRLGLQDGSLRDDVALIDQQILTKDVLVEGTHFDWAYFTPYDLGWKSVAVNVSDIAGTGGVLDGILVGLVLPSDVEDSTVQAVYQGIHDCLATMPYSPAIWGGDTARGPVWMVSVTAIGHIPAGYAAGRRWQAKPGDRVLTTGPHGLAAIGLQTLKHGMDGFPFAKQRHLRPTARLEQGQALAKTGCRYALMDSSDGLADAALKLAHASHVGIELSADQLPTHPELDEWMNQHLSSISPLDLMLYGGEDFELVACWPQGQPIPPGFHLIGEVIDWPNAAAWITPGKGGETKQSLTYNQTYQHF